MKLRIFSFLLVCCMLLLPICANALEDASRAAGESGQEPYIKVTSEGLKYSVKEDGTVRVEGCAIAAVRLVIPSEIDGRVVNEIAVSAFLGHGGIAEVILPESVETIGKRAFEGCENLLSVTLPAGLRSIPERCFANCMALQSVDLPSKLEQIGSEAFVQCVLLKRLVAPPSLSLIGVDAMLGCEKLIFDCTQNEYAAQYAKVNVISTNYWESTQAQTTVVLIAVAIGGILFVLLKSPAKKLGRRLVAQAQKSIRKK